VKFVLSVNQGRLSSGRRQTTVRDRERRYTGEAPIGKTPRRQGLTRRCNEWLAPHPCAPVSLTHCGGQVYVGSHFAPRLLKATCT
jgi:hypothetical protein